MKSPVIGVVAFCIFVAGAQPGATSREVQQSQATQLFEECHKLADEYKIVRHKCIDAINNAKTDEESARCNKEFERVKQEYAARFFGVAEKDPKSAAVLLALLNAFIMDSPGKRLETTLGWLCDQAELHVQMFNDSVMASFGDRVIELGLADGEKLLRRVREKGVEREDRAIATFHLARFLKVVKGTKHAKEAAELLEEIASKYGDVTVNTYGRLDKWTDQELFEVRQLMVDMVAPEIEGKDADGKPFKLSDYRGKVVVLDFFGHNCGPCRAMIPTFQAMLKSNEGKPFTLVGVNNDKPELLDEVRKDVTWRFFYDREPKVGAIFNRWNVVGIPVTYVLDHMGVIRYKNVRGDALVKAVESLLAEVGPTRTIP